jgi:mannose-6-phosphate isomerase-like protein (cupin superfamily)
MKLQGIAKLARSAEVFRKVLHTGRRLQIVVLSLRKDEGTPEENYPHSDQLVYVLHGDGEAMIGGRIHDLDRGDGLFVAAGTRLRLRNTGPDELRVMVVMSPPAFPEAWVQEFREVVLPHTDEALEDIEVEPIDGEDAPNPREPTG